jgi:hypothetical protein
LRASRARLRSERTAGRDHDPDQQRYGKQAAAQRRSRPSDYATELVIVAEYWPGAKFAGTKIEMDGFQLAELIPVLVPVTTVDTPVRSGAATATPTTKADAVIVPAA